MDISLFDSRSLADRLQAISQLQQSPDADSVAAFMRRWLRSTYDCDDVKTTSGMTEAEVSQCQQKYYELEGAFRSGIATLRTMDSGLLAAVLALGAEDPGTAERGLGVCLKRADPGQLKGAVVAALAQDGKAANRALTRLLPLLEGDDARHSVVAPLVKTQKKKKGKAKKKPAPKPAALLKTLLAGSDSPENRALADQLLAGDSLKGKPRAQLLMRMTRWEFTSTERLALFDEAWDAMPSKKARDPGWSIVSGALRLALEAGDEARVVRWVQRSKENQTPSSFKSELQRADLAPWLLSPGIRELVEPKYPKSLSGAADALNASLRVTAQISGTSGSTPSESRVGGAPYLPEGMEWPRDKKGIPMYFLCQLNFAQCPSPAGFPTSGLLLLFVPNDHNLGLSFGRGRSQYAAVWLEKVTGSNVVDAAPFEAECLEKGDRSAPIASKPSHMRFSVEVQPAIPSDVHFERLIPDAAALKRSALSAITKKFQHPSGFGRWHRLGGYASFVQEDPRKEDTADYIQLLQLDSYDPWGLKFGDGGLAHFFIHPDDLAARRFDNMLYCWDCG